jgi:hypothetical protein
VRLEHVPLLQIQRDLYALPRGMERFREYLKTMIGGTDDIRLPLMAMNPMAREHVPARLDQWLALGAESVATGALREAESRLRSVDGAFKAGLVIADDVHGGWTNRFTSDFSQRFEGDPLVRRGWITTTLWASDEPDSARLRGEVVTSVYRTAHRVRHGSPKTLRQMLAQEGRAARFAGMTVEPREWLAQAREVIRMRLDATDLPTCFAALFGDEAAAQLGHAPLGLPAFAGFDVALADETEDPVAALTRARATSPRGAG